MGSELSHPVQTAGVLDDTYAAAAEALSYGAQLTDSGVTFRVWAPTAQQVELVIYSADKKVIASHPMTRDSASGAWSRQGKRPEGRLLPLRDDGLPPAVA